MQIGLFIVLMTSLLSVIISSANIADTNILPRQDKDAITEQESKQQLNQLQEALKSL
jgi:hypothetical protein